MVKLENVGEFTLIRHLTKEMRAYDSSVVLGIGDDAAVIKVNGKKYILLTCDMLVEGKHFIRERMIPEQLGHKALAASLSDIAAMGGIPRYALVSAGWPAGTELDYAKGIYRGIGKLAASYDVFIIGGDTVGAPQLIIDITVVGEMEGAPVTRTGAKEGHVIAVTGTLGASAAGLELLQGEDWGTNNMDLPEASRQALLQSHLLPQPRVKEAAVLLKKGRPSSMIDISDGLVSEVHHLCEGSGVGAELYCSQLPVHEDTKRAGAALGKDYLEWVLYGGEDYELLVTLPEKSALAVKKELHQLGMDFSIIGKIVEEKKGIKLILDGGRAVNLQKKGFDHFSK